MTGLAHHKLIVGKFHPPRRGRRHLIEEAAGRDGEVTALVMAAAWESAPFADRVAWLRADCGGLRAATFLGVPCDVPADSSGAAPSQTASRWRCA